MTGRGTDVRHARKKRRPAAAAVVTEARPVSPARIRLLALALVENPHIRALWPLTGAMDAPFDSTLSPAT